jgi:hypothetical protein
MGILTKRRRQLADIIDKLPRERIELEKEHGVWVYNNTDYEVYMTAYTLYIAVHIKVVGKVIEQTDHYPAEFHQHSREIEVFVKEVYEEENQIYFNASSILELEKSIIETLTF